MAQLLWQLNHPFALVHSLERSSSALRKKYPLRVSSSPSTSYQAKGRFWVDTVEKLRITMTRKFIGIFRLPGALTTDQLCCSELRRPVEVAGTKRSFLRLVYCAIEHKLGPYQLETAE